MSFVVGENVGPYRIVSQLGQGGMASVYKAYHPGLDRYVAIKVLHQAFLEDPSFLARFQREARVIAKLEHPNIVPVYDFAEHAGRPFLVMKFIEGETLKARLGRSRLDTQELLKITEAVGAALSYAHGQGILHRDIKPSNVILDRGGGVFLADFGLARIAQAGESTLSSDRMLGTPHYISPEQARGERDLDEGTDIYSFGVVLYELLVGRVPFSADTPFSIIHDHIYTPLPLPRAINPSVPESAERVLFKALAKDRSDRFETVGALVAALKAALEGAPVEGLPRVDEVATQVFHAAGAPPGDRPEEEETGGSARQESLRRRWWYAAGGLLAACLCFFVFAALANRGEPESEPEPVVTEEPTVASQPGGELPPADSQADTPSASSIAAARARVAENPDDPEARVELASLLFAAGFSPAAADEGLKAAQLYLLKMEYVQAAEVMLRVLQVVGGPDEAGPRIIEVATHAFFLSASTPFRSLPILEELWESYPEWEVLPPVGARAMIHIGQLDEAEGTLSQILEWLPDDPLALAVQAELYYHQGEPEAGKAAAESVLARTDLPMWLTNHLRLLIRTHEGPG